MSRNQKNACLDKQMGELDKRTSGQTDGDARTDHTAQNKRSAGRGLTSSCNVVSAQATATRSIDGHNANATAALGIRLSFSCTNTSGLSPLPSLLASLSSLMCQLSAVSCLSNSRSGHPHEKHTQHTQHTLS